MTLLEELRHKADHIDNFWSEDHLGLVELLRRAADTLEHLMDVIEHLKDDRQP